MTTSTCINSSNISYVVAQALGPSMTLLQEIGSLSNTVNNGLSAMANTTTTLTSFSANATVNQNTFILSTNVANSSLALVTVNGLLQIPGVQYNISNNTLVFTSNTRQYDLVEARIFTSIVDNTALNLVLSTMYATINAAYAQANAAYVAANSGGSGSANVGARTFAFYGA